MTVRWSEPQDYRHTANITNYTITANCTMPSQGSSWVETLTVQDNQKMMLFLIGTVATLTVHVEVCGLLVGNESKALEFCIEGEGCVMVCVCVFELVGWEGAGIRPCKIIPFLVCGAGQCF